ncbi:hypothetical protein LOTGIDRAFT_174135 [Lottia gigantea]|uniref:EF-hand domain-containing protein n=1 Tax=Lottia gigantea TaxID=225164 RepID=V4AYA4_LOTGI|nr:hypothetical protein LOTGIDRAFT_174135 [Lottia gigantea]ESO98601.1 hypothetical protein LOTGIDRAFT_174135 [Lottia gigantea]
MRYQKDISKMSVQMTMLANNIYLLLLVFQFSLLAALPFHQLLIHKKRDSEPISRLFEEIENSNNPVESVTHPREQQGEQMPERAQPCISIHYLMVLKNQFQSRIDPNDDGKATFDEIRQFLRHYHSDVSPETINKFIERRDLNGNGVIELIPEYILDITTPDYTLGGAKEWFNLEDSNGDGKVSRQELETIAQNVGMSRQEAEFTVDTYYMTMDRDGDDSLSWNEYRALYSP